MDSLKDLLARSIPTKPREPNDALKQYAEELRRNTPIVRREVTCSYCGDAGYVARDVAVGHPDFGKLFPCPKCGEARRSRYLAEYSQLTDEMLTFEFARFWAHRPQAPLQAARKLLDDAGWLTLAGSNGTGKTFLLAATVNEARKRGMTGMYTTFAELLNVLRREIKAGDDARFDQVRKRLWECRVLAIDEVDRANQTEWAELMLFELADHRYRNWREQATLWATNNFDQLPDYFQDRMTDGRFAFVEMSGESVRPDLSRRKE